MNLLDILIVNILVFCLMRAFFRGLVKELLSIIGIVAAVFWASSNYPVISNPLSVAISNTVITNIMGFFILFGVVVIIIGISGMILNRLFLAITFIKPVDRIFGTLLGFAKGILMASVVIMVLTAFLSKGSPLLKNSRFSPYVAVVSDKMALFMPHKMKHKFLTKRFVLENSWEDQS